MTALPAQFNEPLADAIVDQRDELSWHAADGVAQSLGLGVEYRLVTSVGSLVTTPSTPTTTSQIEARHRLEVERAVIDGLRHQAPELRAARLAALRLEVRIVGPWQIEQETP
jgi:hypothetical protein